MLNHAGQYYDMNGPLNLPRCPQDRLVFVQAESLEIGRRFAARNADYGLPRSDVRFQSDANERWSSDAST